MEEVKGSNPFRSTNILFIDIRAMNGDRKWKVESNDPRWLLFHPFHPCSRIVATQTEWELALVRITE